MGSKAVKLIRVLRLYKAPAKAMEKLACFWRSYKEAVKSVPSTKRMRSIGLGEDRRVEDGGTRGCHYFKLYL